MKSSKNRHKALDKKGDYYEKHSYDARKFH